MKIDATSLRQLAVTGAALLLLAAAPTRARAVYLLTVAQEGANVVVEGSGSIDTADLTLYTSSTLRAELEPDYADILAGTTTYGTTSIYEGGGLTGPTTFGGAVATVASSGTGTLVGIQGLGTPFLYLSQGYVSGAALTESDTYNNQTFTSLGLLPGTYTYTWGTGADADSLVVDAIPEPSTLTLLGLGTLGLFAAALRRRVRAA